MFADVVLYLQTVLVAESLSERAEIQRQQLLEKLSKKEIPSGRGSYMDMNGRSKGKHFKIPIQSLQKGECTKCIERLKI